MEIARKNDITDYFLDKKLTAKYHEATLLEIVLEAWIDKYNEEIKMFWDLQRFKRFACKNYILMLNSLDELKNLLEDKNRW